MTGFDYLITLIAALIIIGGTIVALCIMYKRDQAEFLPSNVMDLKYDPETEIMSFKGGRTKTQYQVRGQCTVWYSMSGKRLDTMTESKLSDIYSYWKYGKH